MCGCKRIMWTLGGSSGGRGSEWSPGGRGAAVSRRRQGDCKVRRRTPGTGRSRHRGGPCLACHWGSPPSLTRHGKRWSCWRSIAMATATSSRQRHSLPGSVSCPLPCSGLLPLPAWWSGQCVDRLRSYRCSGCVRLAIWRCFLVAHRSFRNLPHRARSGRRVQDPQPGGGVPTIRSRHLGAWSVRCAGGGQWALADRALQPPGRQQLCRR